MTLRLSIPVLGDEELAEIGRVLDSGYLTQGPRAAEFESQVADLTDVDSAFATSSATTGLHLALRALDVGPGDEVIIPDFSFPATANVVVQLGAIPVFVDIRLSDFGMDPDLLEQAITTQTKAIMPVHAFGLVCDMDPILQIAGHYNMPVVEDAACALGAVYNGRHAGALGTAGVFSFHPRKVITTGEGGMITTSDTDLAARISVLRSHGSVRGSHYMSFIEAGYNYRLSDINAAIGVAQMSRLDALLASRRERASRYAELFAGVDGVGIPETPEGRTHTYQSYVILLDEDIDRDNVIDAMRVAGIETTLGTYSMHLQPYFTERFGIADSVLPRATQAHQSALTLPLYPQMNDDDLIFVRDTLRTVISETRSGR